ncbi:ead/Ea22-like family protein, partial [Salmonella enterica]|nr:ead/Ea22-like family protein [Salmonella enterica]EJX3843011.1 ead/Ea22-like family protein [Salmonella enterica]
MTIDKQALREAAEKVNSGEWSYEEERRKADSAEP